jgi:hypothetical protein
MGNLVPVGESQYSNPGRHVWVEEGRHAVYPYAIQKRQIRTASHGAIKVQYANSHPRRSHEDWGEPMCDTSQALVYVFPISHILNSEHSILEMNLINYSVIPGSNSK